MNFDDIKSDKENLLSDDLEKNYEEIKKQINTRDSYIKHNHMEVVSLSDKECVMEVKLSKDSLNPYGGAHGGLLFGLCDTTCGALAFAKGKIPVTLNSTIDYLRPGVGDKLKCISKCLKDGKTVGVYEAYIYSEDKEIVRSTITMYYTK